MDSVAFNKQVSLLYYAKMPYVVRALFDEGSRDSSIASGLLIPVSVVNQWRKFYQNGDFSKISPEAIYPQISTDSLAPNALTKHQPHEIKRIAKAFFEMKLGARVISHYLEVPIATVYYWLRHWKNDRFKVEHPIEKVSDVTSTPKSSTGNMGHWHSFDVRAKAKACFDKGIPVQTINTVLGISDKTLYRWHKLYQQGRFYVDAKEKELAMLTDQLLQTNDSLLMQRDAKRFFDVSASGEQIAKVLKVSLSQVETWRLLYDKNSLGVHPVLEQAKALPSKNASGYYTEEIRRAAKDCFERGYGYRRTAGIIGIPVSVVKKWGRLYKKGRFKEENCYTRY